MTETSPDPPPFSEILDFANNQMEDLLNQISTGHPTVQAFLTAGTSVAGDDFLDEIQKLLLILGIHPNAEHVANGKNAWLPFSKLRGHSLKGEDCYKTFTILGHQPNLDQLEADRKVDYAIAYRTDRLEIKNKVFKDKLLKFNTLGIVADAHGDAKHYKVWRSTRLSDLITEEEVTMGYAIYSAIHGYYANLVNLGSASQSGPFAIEDASSDEAGEEKSHGKKDKKGKVAKDKGKAKKEEATKKKAASKKKGGAGGDSSTAGPSVKSKAPWAT